jgi:hypothetical protein
VSTSTSLLPFRTKPDDRRRHRLFVVQATITLDMGDGWESVRQVGTFYLDSRVQMILNEEGAKAVARDIITSAAVGAVVKQVSMYVERVRPT